MTHGLGYLPYVDYIVLLNNGHISEMGTFEQLPEKNSTFTTILKNSVNEPRGKVCSYILQTAFSQLSVHIVGHQG